jgi:hypothetical protein
MSSDFPFSPPDLPVSETVSPRGQIKQASWIAPPWTGDELSVSHREDEAMRARPGL